MAELALRLSEAGAIDLLLLGPGVSYVSETASCGTLPKTSRSHSKVELCGVNENRAGG